MNTSEAKRKLFSNCCAAVKENEKKLAKTCVRIAKIDFAIYEYIMHDLEILHDLEIMGPETGKKGV